VLPSFIEVGLPEVLAVCRDDVFVVVTCEEKAKERLDV
jgi:hypothetical protein